MARTVSQECLDRMLPVEAYHRGWHLTWLGPEITISVPYGWPWSSMNYDPVVLGRPGQELYRWQYIPSLTEVFEKCRELEGKGQGNAIDRI